MANDLTNKLKTYQELKEQYLTQKQELKDEGLEQKSLTDPDSRRMKNNGSLDICYNVQSVVDAKNHFVVDISTTNDINDQNQLYTMAQKASELLEKKSSTVLADTGYYNGIEIKNCVDSGMNVFIKKANGTMTSADFSPFVVTNGFHTLFPTADETSLGTTRHFLSIYLPHLLQLIPSSYWTLVW